MRSYDITTRRFHRGGCYGNRCEGTLTSQYYYPDAYQNEFVGFRTRLDPRRPREKEVYPGGECWK